VPSAPLLRLLSLATLLLAAAAGCGPPVRLPDEPIEDPQVVLSALRTRPVPSTLFVVARAEYYSGRGVRKGKLLVMAAAPDRIRVETLSPTDDMLSLLASPGGEFTAFERGGTRCVLGGTCPENTGAFLPVPLSIPQIISLLAGLPPVITHTDPALVLRRRTGRYELHLQDPVSETRQVLELDPFRLDVLATRLERDADGLRIRVDFEDYRDRGSYRIPDRIRIRLPRDGTDLSLELREVETDLEFAGDPFTVTCPRGAAVERLLCPGEEPLPEIEEAP